jgi:hypothetical protein
MLRQAAHGRPIVNGHQSYLPPAYEALVRDMRARPIPASIWEELAGFGAGILVYHQAPESSYERERFRIALRDGVARGAVTPLAMFGEGASRTWAFRLGPPRPGEGDTPLAGEPRRALDAFLDVDDAVAAPPTGLLHAPSENQRVRPGAWAFGWAVDDSGIARVRVATELGEAGDAMIGTKFPGVAATFPDLPGADRAGFGFAVPELPPGPHTLRITLVARDGGTATLERRIVVDPAAPQ